MMPDLQPADARPDFRQEPPELPESLHGRQILDRLHYTVQGAGEHFSRELLSGDGDITLDGAHVTASYTGELGSYQLRLKLPSAFLANGAGARIRLRGWQQISYIAIGYSGFSGFEHVKASNPAQDHWFDFSFGHGDLAWGWQHGWDHPEDAQAPDIRLYIKGTPGEAAHLDVKDMLLWREEALDENVLPGQDMALPPRVLHAIRAYELKCFRDYKTQARAFMEDGKCPLYGNVLLDWPTGAILPPALPETGTYQFSWHALHPAVMLMLHAHDTGETGPLFAARDFVMGWLERSYDTPDANIKYAWYDHGTAERCLAMLQLYGLGQAHGFDKRCQDRLRRAIFRHAQLLASEVFYAGHQPTRYHNHAWFQDLVLLATALAFPRWPCAALWIKTAIARLEDQFEKLIVRDGGYSVFVENSIGYHHGVQRLIEFAGNLATLSGHPTEIPAVAAELQKFSDFFRYPDSRRTLSQGDTFRLPNQDGVNPRGQIPYGKPAFTVLPKAGYAIWQGNHQDRPFMLTMLATSLSRTHKHEDNLALSLYFDGVEWLIDNSFHSHEYTDPLPAYLRSAAAHNCVCLPGQAYSIDPGLAHLDGRSEDGICTAEGTHEAYAGLTLARSVSGPLTQLDFTGQDGISQPQETAQLRFHCGEHVTARLEDGKAVLTHPGSAFSLIIDFGDLPARIARGEQDSTPMAGLVGHHFMTHAETDTLIIDLADQETARWRISAVEN